MRVILIKYDRFVPKSAWVENVIVSPAYLTTEPFKELLVVMDAEADVPETVIAEHDAVYPGAHEYTPSMVQVNL